MGFLSDLFGGGDSQDEYVPPPSYSQQIDEYIANLPKLISATRQYGPEQAQLQYDLYSQYAPQYAQAQYDTYASVYPETAGLQEMLAQQAATGTSGELTDSEMRQFLDLQKSLTGEQSTSGIGTDYIGSNLLNYVQGRKAQNQNLALSLLGRQPAINTNVSPNYTQYESSLTPQSALNYGLGQYALYPNDAGSGGLVGGLGNLFGGMNLGSISSMFGGFGGGNQIAGLGGSTNYTPASGNAYYNGTNYGISSNNVNFGQYGW